MKTNPALNGLPFRVIFMVTIGILMFSVQISMALDIGDGAARLVIDEKTGRTAYYRFSDRNSLGYDALIDAADVTFPFATMFLDSKFYKLGEAPEFKVFFQRSSGQISIIYRNANCLIRQQVSLISLTGSGSADAFRIVFEIENSGATTSIVGLRLLLDTILGEKSGNHFVVSGIGLINQELRYGLESGNRSILSPGDMVSLGIETWGGDLTPPSRTILANKQRLAKSDWMPAQVDAQSTMASLTPDSAVGLFWEPEGLAPGSLKRISIILRILPGQSPGSISIGSTEIKRSGTPAVSPVTAMTQAANNQSSSSDQKQPQPLTSVIEFQRMAGLPESTLSDTGKAGIPSGIVSGTLSDAELKAVLDELWSIINSLDSAIANPASASPEKIDYWKRRIDYLGARINSR